MLTIKISLEKVWKNENVKEKSSEVQLNVKQLNEKRLIQFISFRKC